jgi:hypothetical protein
MSQPFPHRSTQPESVEHLVRGVGGTTAITKVTGAGAALTRTGTGAYRITWAETPGTFLGAVASLQATTVGDLAGHTVTFAPYDATNRRLDFTVANASDAAHDLAALEWVTVVAKFVTGSVGA